ncbi:hypothetical protein ACVBAX_21455 [Robertmurraya sp. GLU-23]
MVKLKLTNDNIYDFIEEWHNSDSEKELHEYLGLTFEQYAYWVKTDQLPITDE